MKSKPNQVSWEERFDEEFDCKCGDMGIPHIRFDMSGSETIKAFIRSLLKEERNGIIKMMEKEVIKYSKSEKHSYGQTEQDSGWNACIGFLVSKLSKDKV